MQCEDVALLPREMELTHGRDTKSKLLDIHTFTRFFTYQIPKDDQQPMNVVETRFDPTKDGGEEDKKHGHHDHVLRLRASLRAASMDSVSQSMRVSVIEEDGGKIIIDGSTEAKDERNVHLDSVEISSGKVYIIRYEFFEKFYGRSGYEEQTISGAHLGASGCSKPFVVQELVIVAKELVTKRANHYLELRNSESGSEVKEHELSDLHKVCDFATLSNAKSDLKHGEDGLYCTRTTFTYPVEKGGHQDLNTIFQESFTVSGAVHQPATYLFDLTLGFEFSTAAQLKAVLRRVDGKGEDRHTFTYDPLACLYDHSCVESEQMNKNEVAITVILTSGEYQLTVFDQQEDHMRQWLAKDVGLTHLPFTFELQAVPIVQNEERVMCGDKLYLTDSFIQKRFIEGRSGSAFIFDDFVVLSLINSTQTVTVTPEEDMLLKMASKEAYGINMAMQLCKENEDCTVQSTQVGNTEMLYATLSQGKTYNIELDFSNSIITLSSFFDCPHAHLSVSMRKLEDAHKLVSDQASKESHWISSQARESDSRLAEIFDTLSSAADRAGANYTYDEPQSIFVYEASEAKPGSGARSKILTQRDFTIQQGAERQMVMEIFYDAKMSDLEILIESRDAPEVHGHSSSGRSKEEISTYKGSKRVSAELEPGDYIFKVVAKQPGTSDETKDLQLRYHEFQLFLAASPAVRGKSSRPGSLNYFGLLGPSGKNFGQLVHVIDNILLHKLEHVDLEFSLAGAGDPERKGPTIDVQVVGVDGGGEQLDLSLNEIPKPAEHSESEEGEEQDTQTPPEGQPKSSHHRADDADTFAYESLASSDLHEGTRYRLRLTNKDPANAAKAALKVVITEQFENPTPASTGEIIPENFSEVMRVKPKVPGLKESSFIQGSKSVMEAFHVASLLPFVPKSQKVYQARFHTGPNTDDSFMPSLDFEVHEETSTLFLQVMEFSGREDLFATVYAVGEDGEAGPHEVARTTLGKYANTLGPVTLTKGKYHLLIHPDQDSTAEAENDELIRFGLDVLLEQSDIGGPGDFNVVVEEVELCNLPSLPDNFNGPGFVHPLSGNSYQADGKYRLVELLEGTAVKFDLPEPSLVSFYLDIPEGQRADAALVRIKGTHTTKVATEDLNKGDITFLRQEGGFQHRGVIQIREFLDAGAYMIKLQGHEVTGRAGKVMPRCEPYHIAFSITPITESANFPQTEDCLDSHYLPEHLAFDEVKEGKLVYPLQESTVDVAYIDFKGDGEGPFLFFFQIQYDPRDVGVIGLSLSKHDPEKPAFKQVALHRSPQDGITQVLAVVEAGTYGVGIQTLTSTESMFHSSGLGSQTRASLGDKLMHSTCQQVKYTYFIASALRGDARVLPGGPAGLLSLLVGGGLQKIAKERGRDSKLLDELGDPRLLKSCIHDDLPAKFPVSETGFDESYKLLVQEKPADILDLIVEQGSFIRVSIHSSNPKNQVKVFLYENSDSHDAFAWTTGTGMAQSLFHHVKAQQRAYRLKIEYESLDQVDPCPTFTLRVITKPINDTQAESVHCAGHPLPPAKVLIDDADFDSTGEFAFSSDFISKAMEGRSDELEYDVALEWPNADPQAEYYLDAEIESDFLTGQMTLSLHYEDESGTLHTLGRSHPVAAAAPGGRSIQKLKLLDRDEDLADDVNLSGAILRLKLPGTAVKLQDTLKEEGHLESGHEICHNFRLSIRAEATGRVAQERPPSTRLVRVRWDAERVGQDHFDSRSRFVASLEFDRSMLALFEVLKETTWASLVPEKLDESDPEKDSLSDPIMPSAKTLSEEDRSQIELHFPANTLARGRCYVLKLSGAGRLDFELGLLEQELRVCTSKCHCDSKGTASCDEGTGHCECRFPHSGDDCSQCTEGHNKDPSTGDCIPHTHCVDHGGKEDCHGHGTCEQRGETATCTCNPGFVDDGLEKCAKCADPLFQYPDCQLRNWILEEPDVSCKDLEFHMPSNLSASLGGSGQGEPGQAEDGVLNWAQKYRLIDGSTRQKSSSHTFAVPTSSVFRLFVDTTRSGALVKYRLLNDESAEVVSSSGAGQGGDADGFLGTGSELAILHQPEGKEPMEAPFSLHLEYQHEEQTRDDTGHDDVCPVVDIRVIVEPFLTAQASLRCTEVELAAAGERRQSSYEFGSSTKSVHQHVVLRSTDEHLFKHSGEETANFARLSYNLRVRQSGNALSVVATYPFSKLAMSMSLIDEQSGNVIQLERTASLEGGTPASQVISAENDMATYVEVPALDAGQYRLEIDVQRSLFLPTQEFSTCLGFDLVVEHVVRSHNKKDNEGMYEILSVRPLTLERLEPTDEKVIEVEFDKIIRLDDMVNGLAGRLQVCSLVNTEDHSSVIHPRHVQQVGGSTMRLHFDFWKANIPKNNRCFTLKCSTKDTKGTEVILPFEEETSYCFETAYEHDHDALAKCNPLADPKVTPDGECLCAAPYTGHDCESCASGFKAVTAEIHSESGDKEHNRCVVDHDHLTGTVCNGHGQPKSTSINSIDEVTCECEKGYGGRYCDYCQDASLAYPDCDPSLSASIYDPESIHAFLSRRRYNEAGYSTAAEQYFSHGALEPTVFNEECGWVDYPDDLDRIELMREFSTGDLHFADLYVVNHKQDNIIKFKPRSTGVLKVLVQQPEAEELLAGEAEAAFDVEIGVYDPEQQRFLESSINRHLELPDGRPLKLEYAALSFEVTEAHLSKPLYVFFRALNFTDDGGQGHKAADGCLALFLEAEFRSTPMKCKHNPALEQSSDIHVLSDQSQVTVLAENLKKAHRGEHSVNDNRNTFFTYQDFYIPGESSGSKSGAADREVTVSLQQKFIESNTLDILVEVLETDVALNEISKDAHQPRMKSSSGSHHDDKEDETGREEKIEGSLGPSCEGICMIGGEKAHNEMLRVLELGAGTYFRVWLFQQSSRDRQGESCANYQLLVSTKTLGSSRAAKANSQLRCLAEELPSSLNTPRYLQGPDGEQKDFHYRQAYRVDHLWHNQAHKVAFTLRETSLVRIVAPVHRHLQFELLLSQDQGGYHHSGVVRAKRGEFHSTIFAKLEPGDYHLKLVFVSDAALLQLPCQTVQLEMAMMTVQRAEARAAQIQRVHSEEAEKELSMRELLVRSPTKPLTFLKPGAITWRSIPSGRGGHTEQTELFVPLLREDFEIAEDDDAGLVLELWSDFLLAGVHIAVKNRHTGQMVEVERRDDTNRVVVGHLNPGPYELIVYTHEGVTNVGSGRESGPQSLDLVLQMSLRLLRLAEQGHESEASVPVQILDEPRAGHKDDEHKEGTASPLVVTVGELRCLEHFQPLPKSLEAHTIAGGIDISETFYINSQTFVSHDMVLTASEGNDAVRIFLAHSNSKIALLEGSDRRLIVQSKPLDAAQGQLLIATGLEVGKEYVIVLEFSEQVGVLDGESAASCDHFVMAVKTWDSSKLCPDTVTHSDTELIVTRPESDPQTATIPLTEKKKKRELKIAGTDPVDVEITVDFSGTLYMPVASLKTGLDDLHGKNPAAEQGEDEEAADHRRFVPATIDSSKKHSTTYFFTGIPAGSYALKLKQRFKPKGCSSAVTITVRSWKSATASLTLERGGNSGLKLYQSQAEEQERPRLASRLPLDLRAYKYMGGEKQQDADKVASMIFSGPVQLDEQESQNYITFEVEKDDTALRVYAEHAGLVLTLNSISSGHAKQIGGGMGTALFEKLQSGSYKLQVAHGTAHAKVSAEVAPPRAQLTIMVAGPEVHEKYTNTWEHAMSQCESGSNFPLVLVQQKQADLHELYYNYPTVEVSEHALASATVLQTYNFRVNVTSRLYFEVGMHLQNSQVVLQLSALSERGFTIQGKQRANLNVLDAQIGPGDYSVALKKPSAHAEKCGLFSLQGLVEPISLMSEEANSGEILQRGVTTCPEQADGDVLPPKIFASKGQTKGGGELHVDADGHFMRRFRNVIFKLSKEWSEVTPEYDRVELAVLEDSMLHLSFLYEAYGANEIRVVVTDTAALGQEASPSALNKITDLANNQVELVTEYKLSKGRHYSLMVYYVGAPRQDEEGHTICSSYDLTVSIAHIPKLVAETQCPASGDIPSMLSELPHIITDNDLDHEGEYNFEKVVKLAHPEDFRGVMVPKGHGGQDGRMGTLMKTVDIELSSNFDLTASIEFEFDQALFTISLSEIVNDEGDDEEDQGSTESHLQSPLVFKQNNDHYHSVKRELIADGIESKGREKRHILAIANREPGLLHLLNSDPTAESCLFASIKIGIKATQKPVETLYVEPTHQERVSPTIISCRPDDSPTFLHGRPPSVTFDIIFNTKPFAKDKDQESQQVTDLKEAFKLKAATVALHDGVRTQVELAPVQIQANKKEYREDEYHVEVEFDLSEFEQSASEKLLYAQLVVLDSLVDQDGTAFSIETRLKNRGLPIYVFEQNDMEQLLKEETDEVKQAVADTVVAEEGQKEESADAVSTKSDLEEKVEEARAPEIAAVEEKEVKCLCVHGSCNEGESSCNGGCENGWTGTYCDTPVAGPELEHVNKNPENDVTKDGLYRPQQISDQRMTGPAKGKAAASIPDEEYSHESETPIRAHKIEDTTEGHDGHHHEASSHEHHSGSSDHSHEHGKGSSEEEGWFTSTNLMILVIAAAVLYAAAPAGLSASSCLRLWKQAPRKYRPLSGQEAADSDGDDEGDDPTARRRMLEMSSFSPRKRNQAHPARGQQSEAGSQGVSRGKSSEEDYARTAVSGDASGFPLTSFSSGGAANDGSTRQAAPGGKARTGGQGASQGADDDDAAEQLQRELELFAQDDEEESSLIQTDFADGGMQGYDADLHQPQNFQMTQQQQWQQNATGAQGEYPAEEGKEGADEFEEFEKYFDQKY